MLICFGLSGGGSLSNRVKTDFIPCFRIESFLSGLISCFCFCFFALTSWLRLDNFLLKLDGWLCSLRKNRSVLKLCFLDSSRITKFKFFYEFLLLELGTMPSSISSKKLVGLCYSLISSIFWVLNLISSSMSLWLLLRCLLLPKKRFEASSCLVFSSIPRKLWCRSDSYVTLLGSTMLL